MATFRVDFLGCKVSHADVHEVREVLLRDGHSEVEPASGRADVAVISTCCVTNEAVAKSRKAAARAARTHARVYVTGCGANLQGAAFANLPANVTVPRRVTDEQRRLLQEFEAASDEHTYRTDESFFEKLKSAFR